MSQIDALVVAFPEDAERADVTQIVTTLNEMASGRESLQEFLGAGLNGRQVAQLCSAALSLNIDWVTPEQLILDDESGIPDEQKAAWGKFYGVVEGFQ
ncbi:hypothetical protein [Psychromarinibacter halotolerans]|uniref:Uncharacterized protein n=1 Tax=Psychromarinibacter halotolerans TaxID=1775175 RepID=A0ABV7GZ83_9RHOB